MFNIETLKKCIVKLYAKEQAKNPKFKLEICEDLKAEQEEKEYSNEPFIYISEKKGIVGFKGNGKHYIAKCHEEDKFDKYVGASIVLGYNAFGSKTHFKKVLGVDKDMFAQASLISAYTRFGGKKPFEEYVDSIIIKNTKKEHNELATE